LIYSLGSVSSLVLEKKIFEISDNQSILLALAAKLWSYRDLTYIGKVTVIKTLALPILVQCLTVLPNSPDSILNDIETNIL
jgi:hypothetical protein